MELSASDHLTTFAQLLQVIASKEFLIPFSGVVIGGLITFFVSWHAQRLTAEESRNTKAYEKSLAAYVDQESLRRTVLLIRAEMSTAWAIYKEEYWDELKDLAPGEPYLVGFPIGSNPFPVFDSSPASLSLLDPDTAGLIVRIYMRAKGLIAMIEMNSRDNEASQQHAREALIRAELPIQEGESTDAYTDRLREHFLREAHRMAGFLAMGDAAEGMKRLTEEIDALLLQLNQRIDAIPRLTPPSP